MTLYEVIENLNNTDPELTIYISPNGSWRGESEVLLANDPLDGRLPKEVERIGFEYFLEIEIAQEVIDVWQNWRPTREPTLDEKCSAVIYYAKNDAYQPK